MVNLKKGNSDKPNMAIMLAIIAMILVLCGGIATIRYAWTPNAPTTTVGDTPEPKTLTPGEAYEALFRQLRADKICYDEPRNTFLVHFSPDPTSDVEDPWEGWWQLKAPEFYYLEANKTWFTKNIPDEELVEVWPDVSKLSCGYPD